MASTSNPSNCKGNVADLFPTYPETTWLWIDKILFSWSDMMIFKFDDMVGLKKLNHELICHMILALHCNEDQ